MNGLGLVGYGSDSDGEDTVVAPVHKFENSSSLTTALTSVAVPTASPAILSKSTSALTSVPIRSKKRARFAGPDLLRTVINFDSSQPIDPSVEPPADSDDESQIAGAPSIAEQSINSLVNEDKDEDDDMGPLLDSVLAAAAASENRYAPWSTAAQAQRRPVEELERVPGPPATLNAKKFSFAKPVTVTTQRIAVSSETSNIETSGSETNAGSWAGLLPTTATAQDSKRAAAPASAAHSKALTMEWFCDICNYTIPAGEARWDCQECSTDEWCCCDVCFAAGGLASDVAQAAALIANGSEIKHPHPLLKSGGSDHASCAEALKQNTSETLGTEFLGKEVRKEDAESANGDGKGGS